MHRLNSQRGVFSVIINYMAVEIGHLHKRRLVKDMRGNIIDWFDEVNGGWIVKKREVVNKTRYDEEMAKIQDKKESAKAATMAKVRDEEDYPLESPGNEKKENKGVSRDEFESFKKDTDSKLDAILKAVKDD